jgi:hypothetical protein
MPGCQPIEYVYPNWWYMQTTVVTWQSLCLTSEGRVMDENSEHVLRDNTFIGELGKTVIMSDDLNSRSRFNAGCGLVIVPQKCDSNPNFGSRRRQTYLSIENSCFEKLASIVSSGRFFLRVSEDPVRDGLFLITCSAKIERASFDAFSVGEAISLTPSTSLSGAIHQTTASPISSLTTSVRVVGGREEFIIAEGQLPLHGTQNLAMSSDVPMFVVGPRAWQSLQTMTSNAQSEVSVVLSVSFKGTRFVCVLSEYHLMC